MIRFANEGALLSWVDDMKHSQAIATEAVIRPEDALDKPTAKYVLHGGLDGGRDLQVEHKEALNAVLSITMGGE